MLKHSQKESGRGFVGIMIGVAIFVLLLRISLEQVIKINIVQNQSYAQSVLKTISTALENYAKDHLGVFPPELALLTRSQPPYLDKEYVKQPVLKGYNFSCTRLEPSGYTCVAAPLKCMLTGRLGYSISTGGLITSEDCLKKD